MDEVVKSGKTYSLILADPPWRYKYWCPSGGKSSRSAESHYNVETVEDIAKMPISQIARKDAWLFMWVTGPFVYESEKVMTGWGFKYSTIGFVWYKVDSRGRDKITMGHTTRPSAEVILEGRRGSPRSRSSKVRQALDEARLPEVFRSRPKRHSVKPDWFHARLVELCGNVDRIELFCRGPPVAGWDAMGYEADGGQGTL